MLLLKHTSSGSMLIRLSLKKHLHLAYIADVCLFYLRDCISVTVVSCVIRLLPVSFSCSFFY